jgi:hypothetical protein
MRRASILLFCIALSACNGASLMTQWKLRDFNLAIADLAQLRMAVRGPSWATPTPQNATVEARYWREGEEEAQARSSVLRLQRGAHPGDEEQLAQFGGVSGRVAIELSKQGLAAARAAQQETAQWRATGVRTHGKLHLAGALACRREEIPPGPIPVDVFIHADDETGWLPLYEGFDVRSAATEAEIAEMFPPCVGKGAAR